MGGHWFGLSGLNEAGIRSQMESQRAYVERATPKGPLWFWEHISDPYVEFVYYFGN